MDNINGRIFPGSTMERKSDPEDGQVISLRKVDDVEATDNPECSISPTALHDLPPEILLDIFSSFSVGELCLTISPVCKLWCLLSRHPSLWKHLSFKSQRVTTDRLCLLLSNATQLQSLQLIDRVDASEVLRQVTLSNQCLQKLIVKHCVGSPQQTRMDEEILLKLIKRCSKLVEITMKGTQFYSETFFKIMRLVLPDLKRINFNDNYHFGSASLNIIACYCKPLEEVSLFWTSIYGDIRSKLYETFIQDSDIDELCTRMKNSLQILRFIAWELTGNAMKSIVKCTRLHTLHIREALQVTDEGVLQLMMLHNLSSLEVSSASRVSSEGWHQLFNRSNWSTLRNVSLNESYHVNDTVLETIGRSCLNFQRICLEGNISFTDVGVSNIIKGCKQLIFLAIDYTQVSVVQSFPLIATCIPNLKCLVYEYETNVVILPSMRESVELILRNLKQTLPNLEIRTSITF